MDLSICQRLNVCLDCLVFRAKYSGAGIATRSYVTLYIIRCLQSMRRWSKGRQYSNNAGGIFIVSGCTPGSTSLDCFNFIYIFVVVGVPYN